MECTFEIEEAFCFEKVLKSGNSRYGGQLDLAGLSKRSLETNGSLK